MLESFWGFLHYVFDLFSTYHCSINNLLEHSDHQHDKTRPAQISTNHTLSSKALLWSPVRRLWWTRGLRTEPPPSPLPPLPLPLHPQKCHHSWGWSSPGCAAHCVCMRGLVPRRAQTVCQRASRLLMPPSRCSSIRVSKAPSEVDAAQHKQADVAANKRKVSWIVGLLSKAALLQSGSYDFCGYRLLCWHWWNIFLSISTVKGQIGRWLVSLN